MTTSDIQQQLQERFSTLPRIVQEAIVSADVEHHLRELSTLYKLHIDQWEQLENEVMLAMLGIQSVDALAANVEKEVGVPADVATALVRDISRVVFEPIRVALEHELEKKEAAPLPSAPVSSRESVVAPAPPVPATPPPAPHAMRVMRVPIVNDGYRPGETSVSRASVADDPYREAA